MIQTRSIEKRSLSFRVLSDDQIEEIKWAAFDVMAKVAPVIWPEAMEPIARSSIVSPSLFITATRGPPTRRTV